ncbi:hypothetical protein ACA910_008917 [Epithemia clementina (nom. ined.)]
MHLCLAFPNSLDYSPVEITRNLHHDEMDIFAQLTRSYLRARDIALVSLEPLGQHWRNYQHILQEQAEQDQQEHAVSNATDSITASDDVLNKTVLVQNQIELKDSGRSSSSSLDPSTPIWTIWMTIQAYNAKDIPLLIEEDGKTYLDVLAVGLDNVFVDYSDNETVYDSYARKEEDGQGNSLAWFLSTLTLSLACLFAVFIVRCSASAHRNHKRRQEQRRNVSTNTAIVGTPLPRIPYPLWWHRQWRHQPMEDDDRKMHLPHRNIMTTNSQEIVYDNHGEEEVLSSILPEEYFLDSSTLGSSRSVQYPQLPPGLAPNGSCSGVTSMGGDCSDVGVVGGPVLSYATNSGIVSIESNIVMAESCLSANNSCSQKNESNSQCQEDALVTTESSTTEDSRATTAVIHNHHHNKQYQESVSVSTPVAANKAKNDEDETAYRRGSDIQKTLSDSSSDDDDDETSAMTIMTSADGEILVHGTLVYI